MLFLTWLSFCKVPSEFYLALQPLTLQRIHCPEIIPSGTLWHVKIRNSFSASPEGGRAEIGLAVSGGAMENMRQP